MSSTPDEILIGARDLALAALREITPESTIGPAAGYLEEVDGVISLRFENRLGGYPGWYWTVSVARVDGEEPTVLEAELLPGDSALLAPEWVPWATRLADYQAAQIVDATASADDADGEDGTDADDLDADDLDADDEIDAEDFDDDASPILHSGDVDGVDIDELDVSGTDDDDVDESDDDDDSDDDESDDDDSDDDDESDDDDDSDDESDHDDSDDDDDSDDESDEDDDRSVDRTY